MVYGYCRVSTKNQSLKRQIDALIAYGIKEENIYYDEMSGVVLKRKGLESLKNVLNSGDTLVIKEIDRLGRNRKQTTELIKELIDKDVDIVALDIPYLKEFILKEIKKDKGFMEIMATTLLSLILEVAEQERNKILDRTKEGKELFVARTMVVMAAAIAGVDAIDTVWSDLDDEEGFKAEVKTSMNLGFAGKSCIHPSQIKIVHKIFTPNKEELEKSLEIVRAAEAANINKGGVITVNGKMVDIPVIAKAEKVVRLAKSAGMIK